MTLAIVSRHFRILHKPRLLGFLFGIFVGLVTVVIVVASKLLLGLQNPNKTPITDPPYTILAPDSRDYDLNKSGELLAYQTYETGGKTQSVNIVRTDNAETVAVFSIPAQDVGGEYLGFFGWDDSGKLWADKFRIDQFSDCKVAYMFDPSSKKFTEQPCKQIPAPLIEREQMGGMKSGDLLPQNAVMPASQMFAVSMAPYARKNPYNGIYAVDVNEREYKALGGIFNVNDVRLLDRDGTFIAQLGSFSLVGWASDGSLLVSDEAGYPEARADGILKISKEEIDRILAKRGN